MPGSQCTLTTCCMVTQLPSVASSKPWSLRGCEERGHRFLRKSNSMQGKSLSWHRFMESQLWSPVSAHLHGGSSGESLKARLEILVGSLSLWLPASIKFPLGGTLVASALFCGLWEKVTLCRGLLLFSHFHSGFWSLALSFWL